MATYKLNYSGEKIDEILAKADNMTEVGTATGTTAGKVKLSDATNETSDASAGVAATPKAVKAAYDAVGELKEDIVDIENGLRTNQHVLKLKWSYGYLDGSDGSEHYSNKNIKTDIVSLKENSLITFNNESANLVIHIFENNTWKKAKNITDMQEYGTVSNPDDNTIKLNLTSSVDLIFVVAKIPSSVIDLEFGNDVLLVETRYDFERIDNLEDKVDYLIEHNRAIDFAKDTVSKYSKIISTDEYETTIYKRIAPTSFQVSLTQGHKYIAKFWTDKPLNQNAFYIQLWKTEDISDTSNVIRNFGNVWGIQDTTGTLTYEFIATSSYDGYFRFGWSRDNTDNVKLYQFLFDTTDYESIDVQKELVEIKSQESGQSSNKTKPLNGLKIAWFGTSIPAQGYPNIVGEMTGAIVTNESQGSSACRRGAKTTSYFEANNLSDPYRIKGLPYPCGVYGLMMSTTEKQNVIDNWTLYAPTWTSTYEGEEGAPTSGSCPRDINDGKHQELISQLMNLCYDVRVARHLGINHPLNTGEVDNADLFVIEHAYNDVQPIFNDNDSDYDSMPSDDYDVNTTVGALNSLIRYIYTKNPEANIVLVGHYEKEKITGTRSKKVIEMVADYWSIPLCRLYDLMGISQREITTNGYWDSDMVWHNAGFSFVVNEDDTYTTNAYMPNMITGGIESGSQLVAKLNITPDNGDGTATWKRTMQQINLADDLHPLGQESRKKFAKIISNWLVSVWSNM